MAAHWRSSWALRAPSRAATGLPQRRGAVPDPGLVTTDDVVAEGGAGVIHVPDLAERHQAQLDEGLEAVADAQHEAVPVLEQVVGGVGHLRVAEEGSDELAGAVGLVAAGEAAGQEDDLALLGRRGEAGGGVGHVGGGLVVEHQDLGLQSCSLHGTGAVIFAVGAGEHGDKHPGMGHTYLGSGTGESRSLQHGHRLGSGGGPHGEDGLQGLVIGAGQLGEGHGLALAADAAAGVGDAHADAGIQILRHLQQQRSRAAGEEVGGEEGVGEGEAQAVAEAGLHHGHGDAAVAYHGGGDHLAGGNGRLGRVQGLYQAPGDQIAAIGHLGSQEIDLVAGGLELVGEDAVRVSQGHGKGHQRGGHVQFVEGAGHGVLAADGSALEI